MKTKRLLAWVLTLAMIISVLPMNVLTASAAEAVTYIDRYWDESTQTVISQQKTVSDYTVLTSSSGTLETGWYVLNSDITTTNIIEISGEVHIILMDGCTWTPKRTIEVNSPNKLYIYGQANDTGKIKSNGDTVSTNTVSAAIGSESVKPLGTITINGGTIDVNQPGQGAAIGCGSSANTTGDGIIINGGFVTAVVSGDSAGAGAAIGGNNKTINGAKVTINGGTVTATYSSSNDTYYGGTAIGAGNGGSATVTIRGGYITATNNASGRWAAPAIGAGSQSATVTITGGTIIANSVASYTDASIGGSSATVTIDGGNIQTNDGVTAPKNSAGTALALVTLTMNSVADGTVVTNIDGIEYGKRDVKTIGNKLYLYLPENAEYPTSITAGGKTYYRSGDTATYTDHIHNFTYELVGTDTIKATCSAENCTIENDDKTATVQIKAPESDIPGCAIYTGEALPATVTENILGIDAESIEYKKSTGTDTWEDMTSVPTDKGTYKASITLGEGDNEVTASVTYEIRDYQVTFYNETELHKVVQKGEAMPDTPSKDGYAFGGWFTEGGVQLTTTANITEDTTVYAKWVKKSTATTDTGIFEGGRRSYIWFGNYQQSSLGSTVPTTGTEGVDWIESTTAVHHDLGPYYKIEPIKWQVLENANGQAFLISDQNLDVEPYNGTFINVTWGTSTIRSWLNGYGTEANTCSYDYTTDNFINSAFNTNEKAAIANTTIETDVSDKIFLLSKDEAQNKAYNFTNNASRAATSTNYVYGGGKSGIGNAREEHEYRFWWLRSIPRNKNADVVMNDGKISNIGRQVNFGYDASYNEYALATVRPAFKLNLSNVLFTSAAVDGKGSADYKLGDFVSVGDYESNEYKLTLKDSTISKPAVSVDADSKYQGEKMTVTYSASALENGYLSMIIENADGEIVSYARIADISQAAANANVKIRIPKDYAVGSYNVKFFAEQYNGDKKTDYASDFTDAVNLEVKEAKGKITFDVSDKEQVYNGSEKAITVTPSIEDFTDYKVSYYKVDETNSVLGSTTPVEKAIEAGKYLYVIETTNAEYYIDGDEFIVNNTTLPDNAENYANAGYLTIVQSTTDFDDENDNSTLKADKENKTYTYGEIITITATPRATGTAAIQPNAVMLMSFDEPTANQMALFIGNDEDGYTQISEAAEGDHGTYTMTVDTAEKALAIGANTITAKYIGDANQADYSETIDIILEKKPLTITKAAATRREYNGTNVVAITRVTLKGVIGEDTVAVDTTNLTGTIASANASATEYTRVTLPTLSLINNDLGYYILTPASNNEYETNVTIDKMNAEDFKELLTVEYSVNGGEYTTTIPTQLTYGDTVKAKISFDNKDDGLANPDGAIFLKLGSEDAEANFDTDGIAELELTTPDVGNNVTLGLNISESTNYKYTDLQDSGVSITSKPVTFNVTGGEEQIYASGTARNITFTPSSLTADDFKVSYYKVNENNNVLESATPVENAIETGKYLYVIDFATAQTNYTIENKFEVNGTALPSGTFDNAGYMLIKSGVTGMQSPIYFENGVVNLQIGNKSEQYKVVNPNTGSKVTYKSSNPAIVTVDESTGAIEALAKGTATITATSTKEETTPVYASYTINVGLATKTLTVSDFVVTAQDKVYDGTDEVKISAVLANGVAYEGDNIKVDITGKFADGVAGADKKVKYTITGISGTGAENYVLKDGKIDVTADDSTVTATISKAKVTIICAETTTRTYDGNVQTVDVSAMANGAVFDSTNYTVKYNGGEAPKNVGSYDITVVLNDAAAVNYEIAKQPTAKLVIKAATQDVFSVEGVPERVYYGDSFTLSIDGASGTVTYKITSGKDTVAKLLEDGKTIQIIGVGKVTVEATSVKDGHIDRIATKSFEAHKRVLTPTAKANYTDSTREYDGTNGVDVVISFAAGEVIGSDKVSATGTGAMINADAGNDKIVYVSGITLNGDQKDLYTLSTTSVQTTVNITPIEITGFTFTSKGKTYDENDTAEFTVTEIGGVLEADKAQVSVIGSAKYASAAAGDHTVTFTADSLAGSKAANYVLKTVKTATTTDEYTIEPMSIEFVIGQKIFVYDQEAKEIMLSASDENGKIFNDYSVKYYSVAENGDETELDGLPTEAGNYKAEIVLDDATNYTTGQGKIDVTISEATQDNLVIVGLPGTIEYKGEFELEAVGGEDDGTYEWTAPEGVTLSTNNEAKTTVTIGEVVGERVEISVVKKTTNYEDISAKVVFVPTAKAVTFDIDNLEQTYDETDDVTVTPTDSEATYEVTYNGEKTVPTDAGTYTVKVTGTDNYSGMQTATLTIKKATATGVIEGINEKYTYGDVIDEDAVIVTGLKDDTSAKITYAGTGIYVPQDTPPTKVGNYTVIAEITGKNYETLTVTKNFVIEKKELTVKANDAKRAYGEANPIFTLTYSGFVEGEDVNVLLAEPIATVNANASSPITSDTTKYYITVSGGSAENYKFKYDNTGELTIESAGGTLYITGSTNTAYVNDVFTLHAFIGNSKVNVEWDGSNDEVATISANGEVRALKSGEVTFTATADGNYSGAKAEFTLKVKQSGIILTPTDLVKTYTGERQDIDFLDNADFEPVIGQNVTVDYTLITDPSVKEPIQAGTYSVVYTITDGSYTGGGTTTMYINKADVELKVESGTKEYGEAPSYTMVIPTNVKGFDNDTLLSLVEITSDGAAVTANVGEYDITATLKTASDANCNYTLAAEHGKLTVNAAPLTIKVKDVIREYGAENPTPEYEFVGFKNNETKDVLTGEITFTYSDTIRAETAVNTYDDVVTATSTFANGNYNILPVEYVDGAGADLTITKIAVTASAGTSRSSYLTVKFDKAIEDLTAANFVVKNGEETITLTEVTASNDNKTYTLKGSFSTTVTYTVETTITSDTHEITSGNTLSIKPTSGGSSGGGGGGGGSVTTSYTVKFETDGADEIKDVKVTKNKTVAEPTEPTKDGYTFVGWYTDEELTKAYDFETKVTKNITLYAKWEKVEEDKQDETDDKTDTPVWENPFEDVKADDWYYADVEYAAQNGLFSGTSETTFAPNGIITRAMMVTVLYRNEGEPEVTGETTFEDVDENAYYAKAVVWGQQNGIIKGYSETEFAPDENITREQIAAIMFRYATYKGVAPTGAWAIRLEYADLAEIADYATEGVMYCTKDGLMQGKGNDMFCPKDNATRAEIAAILHRFIEANK